VSRDPNVMIGGSAYALTVILAIRPGRERRLRERILAWRDSPFARLPSTHFARLVVLDRMVFEGPARLRPEFSLQYLLFSATFDGESGEARDDYLEQMCLRMPAELERVFGLCCGAPCPVARDPARFRDWVVASQLPVSAFFAHRPTATMDQIKRALRLRRRVRNFALENAYQRPRVLQERFEQAFPR
jgi:hypothetical protein